MQYQQKPNKTHKTKPENNSEQRSHFFQGYSEQHLLLAEESFHIGERREVGVLVRLQGGEHQGNDPAPSRAVMWQRSRAARGPQTERNIGNLFHFVGVLGYSPVVLAYLARLPFFWDGSISEADETEGGGPCQGRSWDWVCWMIVFPSASGHGSHTSSVGTHKFVLQETLKAGGRKVMPSVTTSSPHLPSWEWMGHAKGLWHWWSHQKPPGRPRGTLLGAAHWRHKEAGPLS